MRSRMSAGCFPSSLGSAPSYASACSCWRRSSGPLFLGPEFHRSIATLQVMGPIPLVVALATALATQLMLPLTLDRFYLATVATGAGLSLVLTAALVPSYGAIGTAVSVVTTETAILLGLYGILRTRGLDPLRRPENRDNRAMT